MHLTTRHSRQIEVQLRTGPDVREHVRIIITRSKKRLMYQTRSYAMLPNEANYWCAYTAEFILAMPEDAESFEDLIKIIPAAKAKADALFAEQAESLGLSPLITAQN